MRTTALSSTRFRWFWGASTVSFLGDALRVITVNLWIFRASGASTTARLIAVLAEALPVICFAGLSGIAADVFDRLQIVVLSNWMRGFFSCGLLLCAALGAYVGCYPLLLLSAVVNVFFTTSAFAAIPNLVVKDLLMSANALLEFAARSAAVAGPAAAAVLFALVGPTVGLAADAASFFFAAIVIGTLARHQAPDRPLLTRGRRLRLGISRRKLRTSAGSIAAHFGEAKAYLHEHHDVAWLMCASYGVTITAAANAFALIFFVLTQLHASAASYGVLLSWGAIASIAASALLVLRFRTARQLPLFGISLLAMVLSGLLIAASPSVWWVAVGVAVSSLANGPYNIAVTTLFQSRIHSEFLGRIVGLDTTLDGIIQVAAYCAAAASVDLLGARATIAAASILGAIVSATGLVGLARSSAAKRQSEITA